MAENTPQAGAPRPVIVEGRPVESDRKGEPTKPYKLKAGVGEHVGEKNDDGTYNLTDRQAAAFRDKFEAAGGGEQPVNESRFPGEAKDEQGSAHGAQRVLDPGAPAPKPAPPKPPLTAQDTPLRPPFGSLPVTVEQPQPEEGRKDAGEKKEEKVVTPKK